MSEDRGCPSEVHSNFAVDRTEPLATGGAEQQAAGADPATVAPEQRTNSSPGPAQKLLSQTLRVSGILLLVSAHDDNGKMAISAFSHLHGQASRLVLTADAMVAVGIDGGMSTLSDSNKKAACQRAFSCLQWTQVSDGAGALEWNGGLL